MIRRDRDDGAAAFAQERLTDRNKRMHIPARAEGDEQNFWTRRHREPARGQVEGGSDSPRPLRRSMLHVELCGILGDDVNQAADFFSNATSIPSLNVTPPTIFGN